MNPPLQTLSRRRLLQTGSITMGLPVLASISDLPFLRSVRAEPQESHDADASSPKRFCCIFFPNGVSLPPPGHPSHEGWHWFPHETGKEYQLTNSLQPLAEFRQETTILSGLSHPPMRKSIAHITADSFLTGADSSRFYRNSISLDQLLAQHWGDQTRFPSLTLSSDGGVGTPGRTQTLSFSSSGRPIPSLASPRNIFNRLFGVQEISVEQQRQAFGQRRSVLDHVLEETRQLGRSLSQSDRQRFDEYSTSIREVEHRLESSDRWLDRQMPSVDKQQFNLDADQRGDAEDYIRAILDLMYIALLTDSTRCITYQITSEDAKGVGDLFPKSLGLPNHHELSHGTESKQGYEEWARYDQFLCRQLAYFLSRLRETADPLQAGSLLDNTLVYYGCSTSQTHKAVNYPLILAGGESLGIRHGEHRRFDQDKHQLSDLYLLLLQQYGLDIESFGGSSQPLHALIS